MRHGCLIAVSIGLGLLAGIPIAQWQWVKFQAPTDLAYDSVEVVDDWYHPERKLFKVHFSTNTDLQTYAMKNGLFMSNITSACGGRKDAPSKRLEGYHWLGDQVGQVDVWAHVGESMAYRSIGTPKERDGRFHYHFWIPMENIAIKDWYQYDLRAKPQDICFFIHGYEVGLQDIIYLPVRTNTVFIPKDALIGALKRAGLKP